MLNKWVWRYGEESSSFWRKIVDGKYDYDPLSLCPKVRNENIVFWLWKNISRPLFSLTDVLSKNLLALRKEGKVNDFGYMCSNGWERRIILRRQLLEWEQGVWEDFIRTLNNANRGSQIKTNYIGMGSEWSLCGQNIL
ncbi:hypothetical protein GQ457_13G020120 [Hibiscus cannabinus]